MLPETSRVVDGYSMTVISNMCIVCNRRLALGRPFSKYTGPWSACIVGRGGGVGARGTNDVSSESVDYTA